MVPLLEASPGLIARLYDGDVKIIFFSEKSTESGSWPSLAGCSVLVATFDPLKGSFRIGAAAEDEGLVTLAAPPTDVWALWTDKLNRKPLLEQLLTWWRAHGGDANMPILSVGPLADLERRLLERALAERNLLCRRNADLQADLSTLRDELGAQARLPPEVYELLENLRSVSLRLIFGNSPIGGVLPSSPTTSEHRRISVRQRLPVWGRGLAGVDLHVDKPADGTGVMAVVLRAEDADVDLGFWQVNFAEMRPGWLPLRLTTPCARSFRDLQLGVTFFTDGSPPSLSMAPTCGLDEFACEQSSPSRSVMSAHGRMLALRVWGGLPGIDLGAVERSSHPLRPVLIVPLSERVLMRARLVADFPAKFPIFRFLKSGKMLLHPVRKAIASAKMSIPGRFRVVAIGCAVKIEDGRCQTPVACKIVAAPWGLGHDDVQREQGILGSSGWVRIDRPLDSYTLAARLTRPWSGPLNLFLLSYYPEDGPGWYAYTVFSNFHLEIDWETSAVAPWVADLPAATPGKESTRLLTTVEPLLSL